LLAVERQGGIILKRQRKHGVDRIAYVKLSDPQVLYQHLGRTPASQSAANALSALRGCDDLSERVRGRLDEVLDDVESAWSRNVSWRSILKPGQTKQLGQAIDLALALERNADDRASASIDFRSFSRLVVDDSKALENLDTIVAALMQRLFPEQIAEPDLLPDDLFATFGVTRLTQPLLVSGCLTIDGCALPDMAYIGIPPEEAHRLAPGRKFDYFLTIENYTSFVRHAREMNGGKKGIVIYTSGFPARAILRSMVDLACRSGAPAFHWGDIDPGGLRIYVHLERALRENGIALRPHLMSREWLRARGRAGDGKQRRLRVGGAQDSCIAQLWDAMATDPDALELEQEALEPEFPCWEE
jgi:hypothetical protein